MSVIGTLRNDSDITWDSVKLQVQFFNKDGKMIDTISAYEISLVLPPHQTGTFRARDVADKPASEYVSHKVIISDADDADRYRRF